MFYKNYKVLLFLLIECIKVHKITLAENSEICKLKTGHFIFSSHKKRLIMKAIYIRLLYDKKMSFFNINLMYLLLLLYYYL